MTHTTATDIKNKKVNQQEDTDYQQAKKVFKSILSGYDPKFTQTAQLDPSDMRFNYTNKQGKNRYYNVEIKARNQDMEKYDTLPLKCSKYCDLIDDTMSIEKPLYIVLLNDSEYFIFDLTQLNWNNIKIKNWKINAVEYDPRNDKREKVKQPTFFIPIEQACCHGLIPE